MSCSDDLVQQASIEIASECTTPLPIAQLPLGAEVLPTPARRIDLKTIRQARREMSAVYRDVRCGRLESSEGTRLVYMLGQIARLIELGDLERRLDRLEGLNRGNA